MLQEAGDDARIVPSMTSDQCPLSPTPPNAGGQIDASVAKDSRQKLRYTYTFIMGTGIPNASCAVIELSRQAVTDPIRDKTLACPRCARVVRLQSTIETDTQKRSSVLY